MSIQSLLYTIKQFSLYTIYNKMFKSTDPIILGRWKVENCNYRVNKKIDFSNYDHCGPCGKIKILSDKSKNQFKVNS